MRNTSHLLFSTCLYFVILAILYLLLSFMDGIADAAATNAAVSILMALYPNKVSTMMSWIQSSFGLGYMIGK